MKRRNEGLRDDKFPISTDFLASWKNAGILPFLTGKLGNQITLNSILIRGIRIKNIGKFPTWYTYGIMFGQR